MFDPRSDIIGLFTNSRIGAASRYSTTSVYIQLLQVEDNEEKEPNDYGDKYVGIMWLRQPRAYMTSVDIGFNSTDHQVIVDCDIVIPKNDKWLKNTHTQYMTKILHTFETTIRRNSSASGKSWDIAEASNIPVSFDDMNPNVYRRVVEVICRKVN